MKRLILAIALILIVAGQSDAARRFRRLAPRSPYGYSRFAMRRIDRMGDFSIWGDPYYR